MFILLFKYCRVLIEYFWDNNVVVVVLLLKVKTVGIHLFVLPQFKLLFSPSKHVLRPVYSAPNILS